MKQRTHFLYELSQVQRALLQLGEAVENTLARTMRAFFQNDVAAARRVVREDDNIDERRADVEEKVLQIIAGQQPFATDLRFLLAALRIADDLERMGDYAEGIAELVVRDEAVPPVVTVPELQALTAQVQRMLAASVKAFVARDATAAAALEQDDDHADKLQRLIYAAMVQRIKVVPHEAVRALHVLFVAHNLERIADRAVNIAERTAFIVTGAQPH